MSTLDLTFNRPYATGREFGYIQEAIENRHLSGNGPFDRRCCEWLQERTGAARVLLTSSCSAALELSALLAGVGPGDEVIVPSFTFVTTASAFALLGAKPVFVDIREDTLNLDEELVERAITPATKAVVPVHYAGVGCDLDRLTELAAAHDLMLIEDAAQGIMASYRSQPLGSVGQLGCLSFHETKNLIAGEGGALLINDPALIERAEVLHEKGTNRAGFFRGEVERYTWLECGSSFLTSEINAAFLWAQLESAEEITAARARIWQRYHDSLGPLETEGLLRRPTIPAEAEHNAHSYHLLLPSEADRDRLIADLGERGIQAIFHYVPLHDSPAGRRYGRVSGTLPVTEEASSRIVRLPLWVGMSEADTTRIVAAVGEALS